MGLTVATKSDGSLLFTAWGEHAPLSTTPKDANKLGRQLVEKAPLLTPFILYMNNISTNSFFGRIFDTIVSGDKRFDYKSIAFDQKIFYYPQVGLCCSPCYAIYTLSYPKSRMSMRFKALLFACRPDTFVSMCLVKYPVPRQPVAFTREEREVLGQFFDILIGPGSHGHRSDDLAGYLAHTGLQFEEPVQSPGLFITDMNTGLPYPSIPNDADWKGDIRFFTKEEAIKTFGDDPTQPKVRLYKTPQETIEHGDEEVVLHEETSQQGDTMTQAKNENGESATTLKPPSASVQKSDAEGRSLERASKQKKKTEAPDYDECIRKASGIFEEWYRESSFEVFLVLLDGVGTRMKDAEDEEAKRNFLELISTSVAALLKKMASPKERYTTVEHFCSMVDDYRQNYYECRQQLEPVIVALELVADGVLMPSTDNDIEELYYSLSLQKIGLCFVKLAKKNYDTRFILKCRRYADDCFSKACKFLKRPFCFYALAVNRLEMGEELSDQSIHNPYYQQAREAINQCLDAYGSDDKDSYELNHLQIACEIYLKTDDSRFAETLSELQRIDPEKGTEMYMQWRNRLDMHES